jgi:hypothetical protein
MRQNLNLSPKICQTVRSRHSPILRPIEGLRLSDLDNPTGNRLSGYLQLQNLKPGYPQAHVKTTRHES